MIIISYSCIQIFSFQERNTTVRASQQAVDRLYRTRVGLREVLNLANNLLGNANTTQVSQLAPIVWQEVRRTLETILTEDGVYMDPHLPLAVVTQDQPGPSTCRVCEDAQPNIVLIPCHHVLCPRCALRVYICPFCREIITGRKRLYFSQ